MITMLRFKARSGLFLILYLFIQQILLDSFAVPSPLVSRNEEWRDVAKALLSQGYLLAGMTNYK